MSSYFIPHVEIKVKGKWCHAGIYDKNGKQYEYPEATSWHIMKEEFDAFDYCNYFQIENLYERNDYDVSDEVWEHAAAWLEDGFNTSPRFKIATYAQVKEWVANHPKVKDYDVYEDDEVEDGYKLIDNPFKDVLDQMRFLYNLYNSYDFGMNILNDCRVVMTVE